MGGEAWDYSVLFDILKPSEIHTHTHVLFKEKVGSNLNVSVGNKKIQESCFWHSEILFQ